MIPENSPISIIEEIWAYLSPFSAHRIEIWGEQFATVEHAYQSAKFRPGPIREEIKNARSAYACLQLSQKYRQDSSLLVADFDKEAVMEQLFRTKLAQHPEVKEILKQSGQRCLVKNVESDAYWGIGRDGTGQNRMGKLWMQLRTELD